MNGKFYFQILHSASLVKKDMKFKLDVNYRNGANRTGSEIAIRINSLPIWRLLYEFNATLWVGNINCINIKILSSSKNKSHMKKQIPSNYREFSDALYSASHNGNVELIRLIIDDFYPKNVCNNAPSSQSLPSETLRLYTRRRGKINIIKSDKNSATMNTSSQTKITFTLKHSTVDVNGL